MGTLLVRPEDLFCSADPEAALGVSLSLTPTSPQIRADSVSHWLNALVAGCAIERR